MMLKKDENTLSKTLKIPLLNKLNERVPQKLKEK